MKKKYPIDCLLFLLCLSALIGCRHRAVDPPQPDPALVNGLRRYTGKAVLQEFGQEQSRPQQSQQWWLSFNDPMLTQYIEEALQKNFTLQQGLARLKQANLLAQQIVADQYPFLDAKMQGSATGRSDESELDFSESLALNFSWQADLWGRLEAAHQAALLDARAEKEALAELSLALSLEIAQAYYELIEVVLLQELLSRQIETNTAAYDLLVLGFANGTAASTDVLQQKELLSSVKAQLPLLKARHAVLANRLQVLLAHVPVQKNFFQPTPDVALPDLPPLPSLGIPADLLLNRPDLRKLRQEVAAADYRVAEAAAERLPTLKIGGSIGLNSSDMLLSIFAEALSTILDWDQKENTVKRRQAKVEEKMAAWSQACLEAVAEVENSLSQEHEQSRLLVALKEQQQVAEALLEQARHRYQHGQADYLPVLSALVSLQKLEQNLIRQQRVVLNYRLQLYSALGGYLPLPASSSSERHTP